MNRSEQSREETHGQPSPIDNQLAAPPNVEPITATLVHEEGSTLLRSRGAVLATLFLVTGVLGVPLLWMNPRFGRTERIVWTIIVTVYTIALIAIAYAIVMWSYRQIMGV